MTVSQACCTVAKTLLLWLWLVTACIACIVQEQGLQAALGVCHYPFTLPLIHAAMQREGLLCPCVPIQCLLLHAWRSCSKLLE